MFTIDNDRNITSFNRAAERITGYFRKEAVGKKCYEVFHASICQDSRKNS
ncbi:PAS domain S-box protein [bacterium]